MDLTPGARLGPYEILAPLGAGGMGEVYQARDPKLNRVIAIKVLPEATAADPDRRARFEREAQSAAALSHPNIVTIHSVEEADGVLFLTMEYVEGKPLSDLIVKGGLPLTQILSLAIPLADAVSAAHQRGITHRDLKPANVMVTADGRPKVLDFGLAKLANASPVDDGLTGLATAALTGEGRIVGTVAYMSPEQAEGKPIDHRTDIFSLGVMLYELTTGERPFQGDTSISVLSSIIKDSPQSVAALKPSLPHDLSRIIHRCLVKDADHRYQTAKDLRNELEDLKRDTDVRLQTADDLAGVLKRSTESSAIPVIARSAPKPRTVRRAIATAATVVGVGVIVTFVYLSRPRAFHERDSVVIADFANTTGAPVFDDTLKEALEVELRQSPFLSVLSEQRVQGTLRLMGRAPGDKLTPDVARDLCQRTASKAMIAGAIAQLGKSYVISLGATNCRTGDTIDKRQVEAASQEEVLKALGSAAGQLRRGLGESLASIAKYDAPIQEATTKSLDALKSYSLGLVTRRRQGDAASLPFFRKAIEQDPDFALAHARLSTVLSNLLEFQASIDEIRKAYQMKDRVSEPERLYIIARYYTVVEYSLAKTIDTYQVWIQTYPNDYVPHSNLGNAYQQRNEHAKAAEEFQTAIRLAPDEPLPYGNLAYSYVALGKLDEAHKTMETAIAHGLDSTPFRAELYTIACLKKDDADMARQLEAARRFSDSFLMLPIQVTVAAYRGQVARAREATALYESESIAKTGLQGSAANLWAAMAEVSAGFDDKAAARAEVQKSLALDRSINTLLSGAATFANVGDVAAARKMLDDARRSLPASASPEAERLFQTIDATVRVSSGDKSAIDAIPPPKDDDDIASRFTIGRLNLLAGSAEIAATRFKEVMENRIPRISMNAALAPLFYGRALVKLRRTDEARKAYEQFFDGWKSADPALPILISARLEYKKLPQP
jgi:serine/threonine protein kinase/tetratricopeptide (TPR) repeat protein